MIFFAVASYFFLSLVSMLHIFHRLEQMKRKSQSLQLSIRFRLKLHCSDLVLIMKICKKKNNSHSKRKTFTTQYTLQLFLANTFQSKCPLHTKNNRKKNPSFIDIEA